MILPTSTLTPTPSTTTVPPSATPSGDPEGGKLENWSSLIGIVTAIVGNILIALALNVQRYAHIQLHRRRREVRLRAKQALKNAQNGRGGGYGTLDSSAGENPRNGRHEEEDAQESDPLAQSFQSGDSRWSEHSGDDEPKVASTYLKSPYWWLGQVLITVGEMGNFLAYGFAPASIVSPLGVVALISNCVIAPILFKEVFRKRDFWGVVIAVAGAVTVVLSANQKETKLAPHDVWDAITTLEFEVYMGVTCFLIIVLMWASPKYGNRTILLDLGLVGLCGGYTALATKGVSSMLSSTLFGAFTTPVTYVLILVLLVTAVMQVRYVNKALQRFDSTQVIPIQFVMFTLSVIIGSAVLYRDFERTTAEQAVKFVGGCLLTFFGVFLITSNRPPHDDEEDALSDVEGVEETINLAVQDPAAPAGQAHHDGDTGRSRRSSRVSFMNTINKPLTALAGSGLPNLRAPAASTSRQSLPSPGEDVDSAPILNNPWRESLNNSPVHPGMGQHAFSTESAVTMSSVSGVISEPATYPPTPSATYQDGQLPTLHTPSEAPVTPRAPRTGSRPQSHHFTEPLFSPSPLSSTVAGLVSDTLLKHMDSPTARRLPFRRSRPSLRASLFVPQDEAEDDEAGPESSTAREGYVSDGLVDAEEEDQSGDRNKTLRGRARSLSNTLSDLFGGKKKRRSSNPDETEPLNPERVVVGRQRVAATSTETL